MEFRSETSSLRKFGGRQDYSVYENVVRRYAQTQTQDTPSQALDPTQLQVGQSVYDASGKEYRVVENPDGTTSKVLMPKDQQDPNNPTVQTVEDSELAAQYNVQPPTETTTTARKHAQEDVDWNELQSLALELLAYTRRENLKQVLVQVEEITNLLLEHMEVPEGFFEKAGSKVLPEFRQSKVSLNKLKHPIARLRAQTVPETSVFPDVRSDQEHPEVDTKLNTKLKKDDDFEYSIGQAGYVDIMNDIRDMLDAGYQTVDVILNIGERYPREQGEQVLEEARRQGIL